jgi:hypothetical protein
MRHSQTNGIGGQQNFSNNSSLKSANTAAAHNTYGSEIEFEIDSLNLLTVLTEFIAEIIVGMVTISMP